MRRSDAERRIIPVALGDGEVLADAPAAVLETQALIVEREAYAAGPEGVDWDRVIATIADDLHPSAGADDELAASVAPQPAAALPQFSAHARTALTYAAQMLANDGLQVGKHSRRCAS